MMRLFQKYFFSFVIVASLLIPQQAIAQTPTTPAPAQTDQCKALKDQITNAGGSSILDDLPAYCTPGAVYTKVVNFAIYAAAIAAVLAIIYGGYLYMTARGNAAQAAKGRTVLTWAIIGLVVVLAAAVIVNIVVRALVVDNRFV